MQELQPQIAELLRTCVQPPSLLLRIAYAELIDVRHVGHDQAKASSGCEQHYDGVHRFALKFVLTDGELMIQALLHRKLNGLQDAADVNVGDLLDIRTYTLRKSARLSGQGHTAYLAIEKCHFLLRPFARCQKLEENEKKTAALESRKRRRRSAEHLGLCRSVLVDEDDSAGGLLEPSLLKRPRLGAVELALWSKEQLKDVHNPQKGSFLPQDRSLLRIPGAETVETMPTMDSKHFDAHNSDSDHSMPASKRRHGNGGHGSTFGARTISSEDEDGGIDCFEEAEVDLEAVKLRREALQKLDLNTFTPPPLLINQSRPVDHMAARSAAASATVHTPTQHDLPASQTANRMPQTEPEEAADKKAQNQFVQPWQQTPKRDGTFALSQMPTALPRPRAANIAPQTERAPPVASIHPTPQPLLPTPAFHTLRSLRDPPPDQPLPNKNYIFTTLAVISWTGTTLIHRPNSPFPPKRHLKIVDPSLVSSRPPSRDTQPQQQSGGSTFTIRTAFQDAVTVAVYIDAANFKPAPGTLALFRGVVMQRLANGDIILNAYGRLKEQRFDDGMEPSGSDAVDTKTCYSTTSGTNWFITNEAKIRALGHGSKLDYYREWWWEKQQANRSA